MLEVNIIGHLSDLNPLNGLFLAPVVSQFSYFGVSPCRNFVAAHTTPYRRNTSYGGPSRIDMAVLAGDFVVTRMDLMAEYDRLLRRRRSAAGNGKTYHDGYGKKCQEAYSDQPLFHLALFFLTEASYISDEIVDLLVG